MNDASPAVNVHILLTDAAGRTFMQMRDGSAATAPLVWSLWGGRVEPSDASLAHAAARELREETGVERSASDFSAVAERQGSDGQKSYLMRCLVPVSWRDIEVHEGAGGAFFWREELEALPIAKAVRQYLERNPELFAPRPRT